MSDFRLQSTLPYINSNPRHERPIWIWDRETAGFVWANGEGIKFWSAHSLEDLQATPFDKTHPAWIKVCQVLDGVMPPFSHQSEVALTNAHNAIGMNLYFPHKNGGAISHRASDGEIAHVAHSSTLKLDVSSNDGHFVALCRLGHLKNRTTLIVEVVAQSDRKKGADRKEDNNRKKNSELKESSAALSHSIENVKTEMLDAASSEVTSDNDDKDLILGAQLKELARLIEEAGDSGQDILTAETYQSSEEQLSSSSLPLSSQPVSAPKAITKHESTLPSTEEPPSKWGALEIDLIALSGVGDQDELEALFDNHQEPYALVSLQKIIHANEQFVSEFGYDDLDPLINDGCDWLFPQSREIFSDLLTDELGKSIKGSSMGIDQVRLRSGRKLKRDVLITPVKLTKFDRVLLLLQLAQEFDGASNVEKSVPSTLHASLPQSLPVEAEGASIPLLSAISHEVRTPLNVILGFSEIMALEQFGVLGNEKYKDYAHDIHKSAEHALSLINDLLDLTKLKAGKWDVSPQEIDLNKVVRQQVRLMREMAAKVSVRLRSDLEENLPLVMADERCLLQILLNLISNGIKYAADGDLITVQTRLVDESHVLLTVSDTGAGMSADEIQQAMEPFHQVSCKDEEALSPSLNPAYIGSGHKRKGTGLGLPISKALAEANSIAFDIDSQKNKGTTIQLTFSLQ